LLLEHIIIVNVSVNDLVKIRIDIPYNEEKHLKLYDFIKRVINYLIAEQ